jgi:hypothetical protein
MHLEKMEFLVDGVNEADASGQQVEGADAAVGNAVNALGDFIKNVAGTQHRFGDISEFGFVESVLDLAFAVGQPMRYRGFHSKTPFGSWRLEVVQLSDAEKNKEFRVFFKNSGRKPHLGSLDQGLATSPGR